VLVTMMGSVRERTDEIGIFRAVGFRRSHIMRIVFLEAGIISGLAGIIGYGLGLGCAQAALALLSESHGGHVPFNPALAVGSLVLALALGLAASAYPAAMAARLDPNEALRAL
jgi:putative ABC transport system permease protein